MPRSTAAISNASTTKASPSKTAVVKSSKPASKVAVKAAVKTVTKATSPVSKPPAAKPASAAPVAKSSTKSGRLSKEELLKMKPADYMNTAQLAYFRAELEQMRADILQNASDTTEHLRENEVVPDPADRATIEEEHALELRTRDRERKLLKKIAQSLEMIDKKEYGWCEETGDPIGLPRLLARPTASLTLEAQQRRELRQKRFGD